MPAQQEVSIYTVLVLLRHMRSSLGVEAMGDFLDAYTAAVERMNPRLKQEVDDALRERALANLYEAVRTYDEE